jgi:non-canonical (house-cleaning) NTP pyrophosphatase
VPDRVIVASTDPVKIACTRRGFARMFPGVDFDVRAAAAPSEVSQLLASPVSGTTIRSA